MTNKSHRDAALIARWINDTSQIIERSYTVNNGEALWLPFDPFAQGWDLIYNYRLKQIIAEKPKVKSSLTDKEIMDIYWKDSPPRPLIEVLCLIADAAAKRAKEDFEHQYLRESRL